MSSGLRSSPPSGAAHNRRPRKNRQLSIPADALLNFARYHPRSEPVFLPHRGPKRHMPPRRREQFVQANYRFAVNPEYADGYAECTAKADAVIPWAAVDVVFMHHQHDCPICLHPLRCARVTPCGHVFDFVCMLQHFSHSADSDNLAKCPLCSSLVCAADLRTCVFIDPTPLEVGGIFDMSLISRERGSMLAHTHPAECHDEIPHTVSRNAPCFSRFAFSNRNHMLQLVADNMCDLRQTKQEDLSLSPYVDAAMSTLTTRKRHYLMRCSRGIRITSGTTEEGGPSGGARKSNPLAPQDLWYFYQSRDSQNAFLHPLNHRCITTELAGDFSRAETRIYGLVLQIERHTMNGQLRKRYRFLEHLPDGCEFSFVELELTHMLSDETLITHSGELKGRTSARRRKTLATAREDKRLEQKRSESLHEYFSVRTFSSSLTSGMREVVDSGDVSSFPALHMNSTSIAEGSQGSDPTVDTQQATLRVHGISPWGAAVSSYSSVTSNMGLFPALGQANGFPSSPQSQAALSSVPGGPEAAEPSCTIWEPECARKALCPSNDSRKGRKSHGRTTILLSNAGSSYRR